MPFYSYIVFFLVTILSSLYHLAFLSSLSQPVLFFRHLLTIFTLSRFPSCLWLLFFHTTCLLLCPSPLLSSQSLLPLPIMPSCHFVFQLFSLIYVLPFSMLYKPFQSCSPCYLVNLPLPQCYVGVSIRLALFACILACVCLPVSPATSVGHACLLTRLTPSAEPPRCSISLHRQLH